MQLVKLLFVGLAGSVFIVLSWLATPSAPLLAQGIEPQTVAVQAVSPDMAWLKLIELLGPYGFAIGYAIYTTTKTLPGKDRQLAEQQAALLTEMYKQQMRFLDELSIQRKEFNVSLEKVCGEHRQAVDKTMAVMLEMVHDCAKNK